MTSSRDRRFAFGVAVANTLVYLVITGVDTYLDAQLTTNEYGARHYAWGYHVLWGGVLMFAGSYILQIRITNPWGKSLSTYGFAVLLGVLVSLANFRPPCPNWNQGTAWFSFLLPGALASIIRYYKAPVVRRLLDPHVPIDAKIAWVTESSAFWRNIALSAAVAGVAFIVSWQTYLSDILNRLATDPHEQRLVKEYYTLQNMVALVYYVVPVYECLRKGKRIGDLLLTIRTDAPDMDAIASDNGRGPHVAAGEERE